MKHLFILRHAKSSWDDSSIADFDRPLNARGLETAPFMGELLAARGIAPELIVTSPAKRALETAIIVKEASGLDSPLKVDERIYEASTFTLRNVIAQMPEDVSIVLMVGHNPGLEGIIHHLTGQLQAMPTAALASIALNVPSWEVVDDGVGILNFLIRPKEEMKKSAHLE